MTMDSAKFDSLLGASSMGEVGKRAMFCTADVIDAHSTKGRPEPCRIFGLTTGSSRVRLGSATQSHHLHRDVDDEEGCFWLAFVVINGAACDSHRRAAGAWRHDADKPCALDLLAATKLEQ